MLGESASTDSECPSDSGPSDSDASDPGRRHDAQLRLPLALGNVIAKNYKPLFLTIF